MKFSRCSVWLIVFLLSVSLAHAVVLSVTQTNVVNGSGVSVFCAQLGTPSYNYSRCNSTGSVVGFDTSWNTTGLGLLLPLANATYFNGSSDDQSPSLAQATLNGKTLNHGKFNSTPIIVPGVFGNAYKINDTPVAGVSYIEIPTSPIFNMSSGFTIGFWVNASTTGINYDGPAIYKTTTPDRSWRTLFTAGNKLTFQVCPDGSGVGCISASSVVTVVNNSFVYITEQWNGSHVNVYVNGVINGSSALSSTPYFGNVANLTIGKTVSQGPGNATYDEVRIWNASLNSSEILAEMASGFPVRGKDLLASYSFELNNITSGAALNTTADTNYLVNGSMNETGSYYFDAINDYLLANVSSLNLSQGFSISAWVRTNNRVASTQRILYDRSGNNGFLLQGYPLSFFVGNGTNLNSASNSGDTGNNSWLFVVGTYDGQNIRLYFNGSLVNSGTLLNANASSTLLGIGASETGVSGFNGSLGRFRIYNRSLSADEVRDLYNGQYFTTGLYNLTTYNTTEGTASITYLNGSYFNFNFAGTAAQTLNITQGYANVTASQLFTNAVIQNFTVTNGLAVNSTVNGSVLIPVNVATQNMTVLASGNYSMNLSVAGLLLGTVQSLVTGVYDDLFTVGAMFNGQSVLAFEVKVNNALLGGQLYDNTTTQGAIVFPLLQGYNYFFTSIESNHPNTVLNVPANNVTNLYNASLNATPKITLNGPADGSNALGGSVSFQYTPVSMNNLSTCSLLYNSGQVYYTVTTPVNGSVNSITVTGINQFHPLAGVPLVWQISCNDTWSNTSTSVTSSVYTQPNSCQVMSDNELLTFRILFIGVGLVGVAFLLIDGVGILSVTMIITSAVFIMMLGIALNSVC